MTLFEWTQELSVGNENLDKQHKKLFETINTLHKAMTKGKSTEVIPDVIKELSRYSIEHFTSEEKYMADHNYPKLEEHKEIHKDFIKQFNEFQAKINKEGPTPDLSIRVQVFLGNWWRNHILIEDMKYKKYIKDNS